VEIQPPYGCLVETAGSNNEEVVENSLRKKASFKYEELLTILDNNEAAINSRPLTDLSENPKVCFLS